MERKQELQKRNQSKDGRRHDIDILEINHVPYNKHSWKVHTCSAVLHVADYDGSLAVNRDAWTEITLSEFEGYESGRQVERNISITLKGEMRDALIRMLSRPAQPIGDSEGNPHPQANLISVAEES